MPTKYQYCNCQVNGNNHIKSDVSTRIDVFLLSISGQFLEDFNNQERSVVYYGNLGVCVLVSVYSLGPSNQLFFLTISRKLQH
jgi:hypothetical protein